MSHVLNHADRVSKPLRERVQAAIDELGYVPNPQAQSLRTGRTNLIAMLIPDILNSFYTELVKVTQLELEKAGMDLLIFNTDVPGGHSQDLGREYLRQIRSKRVDGMIVGDFALHGIHDELLRLRYPAVFIGDLPSRAVDSIELDDFGGCYAMGTHLAKQGHRRVANVTGPSFFKEAMSRALGFEQGLADHGSPPVEGMRFEGSYLPPSGQDAARWILAMPAEERPSAVFFASHLMASGALAEFYDNGFRVPEDIAVSSFDDLPHLKYARPRPTYVGTNPARLATRAAQMLLERLAGKYDGPPRREVVPYTLTIQDTA